MTAEQPLDLHVFATGDRIHNGTSPIVYTVTKVTKTLVHAVSENGTPVKFKLKWDDLTPAAPAPKLGKKAQREADAWAKRVEAEGFHVGQEVMATRITEDSRGYVKSKWEEPAVIAELRTFDALVRFEGGAVESSGFGLRALTETPTPLLHPKREVFDVKACKGNEVLEVITINGSLKRARSVAEMLGCKYGFGTMHIDFKTSFLEYHQGLGNMGVEIEDLDPDAPFEVGPFDEDLTAEMAAD
ncbi:hypothetical protein SEA_LYMARA_101 [Arthrobacter phage Lymara]|uniref:Uncharacterized protein n=1 Tax=Arthrobacter phage Lymara TaxID=2599828 RepID=A0A5J6U2E0_9CAUD|nr:hypothetical protein HYQ01_gp101 [Arthrobacter phage Lymara]QFG14902.1 hypothetical protein SEA_LYMARA_101 [Arthrobacter phage Lymara]